MAAHDPWESINEQDEATLDRFVDRLELRGRDERFARYTEDYLDAMRLAPDARVLEIGSGTGVVARAVAGRAGFRGHVLGIEQSPRFVEVARELAQRAGVAERIEFRVGDALSLDLADASFDVVIAHTLLSHVAEPLAVLTEAARVMRPGGSLVVFDADFASVAFGHPDTRLAEEMEAAMRDTLVQGSRVLRVLPRLLRDAGFRLLAVQPHIETQLGEGGGRLDAAETYGPMIGRMGRVPAADTEAWVDGLRRASQDGVFFATLNFYAYIAERQTDARPA